LPVATKIKESGNNSLADSSHQPGFFLCCYCYPKVIYKTGFLFIFHDGKLPYSFAGFSPGKIVGESYHKLYLVVKLSSESLVNLQFMNFSNSCMA